MEWELGERAKRPLGEIVKALKPPPPSISRPPRTARERRPPGTSVTICARKSFCLSTARSTLFCPQPARGSHSWWAVSALREVGANLSHYRTNAVCVVFCIDCR